MRNRGKEAGLSPDIAEMKALGAPRWVLAGAWRREVVAAAVVVARHAAAHDPGLVHTLRLFELIAAGLASSVRSPELDRGGAARALVSLAGQIGAQKPREERPCK